jgi:hypothetical protein
MERDPDQTSSSFAKIKRSLDPSCSYLVFEKPIEPMTAQEFPEIREFRSLLAKSILEEEIHYDQTAGRLLSVMKIDSDQTEAIMSEFINIGLAKHVTCYFYGREQER